MANAKTGKVWSLDTAELVVDTPVVINHCIVTWKVASAGAVVLTEFDRQKGIGIEILNVASSAATSAATNNLSQVFPINATVQGLHLGTLTDVADLKVYTK